jgi:hypothetical protein
MQVVQIKCCENSPMKLSALKKELTTRCELCVKEIDQLFRAPLVVLGKAVPPNGHGVYVVYDHRGRLSYVGIATGSKGLRDRLLSKHVSGADSHAIQRAYMKKYPDRKERRTFIKAKISVRWLELEDDGKIETIERLLIWQLQPPWNLK